MSRALIRILALGLFMGIFAIWLLPKVRLHPASMGITNNNWDHGITYRSADGRVVVMCDFMGHDSSPYWEGQNNWDDQLVCLHLPKYLHQGLPPQVMLVQIDGREVELRAPLVWGRLL